MTHDITAFEGQGWLQLSELLLAFLLSALIGLERQLRGKSAGLRTQAIVGTSAALFLLVSKYGFMDVLSDQILLDPSRVAAQIVSGIGFLGAGLILTRRGTVRGLTTAASVWETAAVGMAAGAGLWTLALGVTALHFVIAFGLTALARHLPGTRAAQITLEVVYLDGQGLLRHVLHSITETGWAISRAAPQDNDGGLAILELELEGTTGKDRLITTIASINGIRDVQIVNNDDTD